MISTYPLTAEDWAAAFGRLAARAPFARDIVEHKGQWAAKEATRRFYELALPEILAADSAVWAIDPYEVDWMRVFTPIEEWLWYDIRTHGAVLYPQFPIGRYFADFANPVAKIVVECDGKAWHTDKERDAKRDGEMRDRGYVVYRVPGNICRTCPRDTEDGEEPAEAQELMRALCRRHRISLRDFALQEA